MRFTVFSFAYTFLIVIRLNLTLMGEGGGHGNYTSVGGHRIEKVENHWSRP